MRIGVVTTSYPREPGDSAGHFVAGCARWLAEAGASVEVVAAGPGVDELDGIPVARVGGRGLFYAGGAPDVLGTGDPWARAWAWARAGRFVTALAAHVERRLGRWDAVVSHWVAPSGLTVAAALGRRRKPHLAVAHSSDVALLRTRRWGRAALAMLSRQADLVYAAPHLIVDGAPGRVVPMGIDVAAHIGQRERGRIRFELERTAVLFLGRLVPIKGVDRLIDALVPGGTLPPLELVVAGDGPERKRLLLQARERGVRARFVGEVRGQDKADLLAAADLLVVPSLRLGDGRSEGTPTVIFEGLAAGLPLIVSRAAQAEHVLHDGQDALLVDPEPAALRNAVARLAVDQLLRHRLSRRARQRAAEHDWSQVGPRLCGGLLSTPKRRT